MLVDILHLFRNLRRAPASAAAAVATLSLTLGAAASIFALVDAVVLTPRPFSNPDAIVSLGEIPTADPSAAPRTVSYATFEAWRERAGSVAALEASDGTNFTLTELGAAERVSATNVTPGVLSLLGVTPALGRSFDRDDVGQPVVIISHAFWRGKLGGDPGVIGASRRAELALRIALGADPRRLMRSTIGQGAVMVGLGLAAGGLASIWSARALGAVSGRSQVDVVSIALATAVLVLAGIAAVLPAALRAARTDPLTAFRAE